MRSWMLVALFGLVTLAPARAVDAPSTQPLVIGEQHVVASHVLGEPRTVNVVLPPGYAAAPDRRYPVLYVVDGGVEQDLLHVAGALQVGSVWGRTTGAIVVGLETRDRRRELVGPTRDADLLRRYPTVGGSAAFRAFVRDEVQPLIRSRYRTTGRGVVVGESLAGLFIVETWLVEPTLFDAYAAIDPSLWWDKERLSLTGAAKVGAQQRRRPLYLAMAKEQSESPAAMARITRAARKAGTRWCLAARPDLLHSTIYQQLTPEALQFLLPPPAPPPAEFGFTVRCTEGSAAPG